MVITTHQERREMYASRGFHWKHFESNIPMGARLLLIVLWCDSSPQRQIARQANFSKEFQRCSLRKENGKCAICLGKFESVTCKLIIACHMKLRAIHRKDWTQNISCWYVVHVIALSRGHVNTVKIGLMRSLRMFAWNAIGQILKIMFILPYVKLEEQILFGKKMKFRFTKSWNNRRSRAKRLCQSLWKGSEKFINE